jgi:hypothetical protein
MRVLGRSLPRIEPRFFDDGFEKSECNAAAAPLFRPEEGINGEKRSGKREAGNKKKWLCRRDQAVVIGNAEKESVAA